MSLSLIEITLVIDHEHFVLLPIVLSLLNRVGCQLNRVFDISFELFVLRLTNPVLEA